MASSLQGTINSLAAYASAASKRVQYNEIYKENCDRIYSLSFWMTGNELAAEQMSANTFLRAFAVMADPTADQIDRAFLSKAREVEPIGVLTLSCAAPDDVHVNRNIKRIHLENAVVQLPATEKLIFLLHDVEGYAHDRVARLLGISEEETKLGLHQARLRIRELVSHMR